MAQLTRKGKWLEVHISNQMQGKTLEAVLREEMRISGRMLQRLTRKKGIELNGRKGHLAAKVKSGDRVRASIFEQEDYGVEPEHSTLDVLYEDDHLLVVNKPAGIAVHPTDPKHNGTLAHGLAFHYQLQGLMTKIRHVHRLDKDTSGVLLVAKHELAHSLLDEALRERKIKRNYVAVVQGKLAARKGSINQPIGRDRHHPTRRRVSPGGDAAVTHYHVRNQFEEGAVVSLELETGRTHQIRVHMSYIGHPLFGDRLYGGQMTEIGRQALHGEKLTFLHPFLKESLEIEAPIPEDMLQLIKRLQT